MNGALIELLLFAALLVYLWRYTKRLEADNAARRREAAEQAARAAPEGDG